ncbi:hypothetical protein D1872_36670 [compost metagenome]
MGIVRVMYLLFNHTSFIGFSPDKELVERAKQERYKQKFSVRKFKQDDAPIFKKDRSDYNKYELIEYPNFNRVMTGSEYRELKKMINAHVSNMHVHCMDMLRLAKYLRLDDDERLVIESLASLFSRIVSDLYDSESCVDVHDYFDIETILDQVLLKPQQ